MGFDIPASVAPGARVVHVGCGAATARDGCLSWLFFYGRTEEGIFVTVLK